MTGSDPGLEPILRAVRGETPIFLFLLLSPARLLGTRTKPLSCSASGLELGLCLLGPVCACAGLSALSLVSILVTKMNILLLNVRCE